MPRFFIVDLFAGTRSVSRLLARAAAADGYDVRVFSADIHPRFNTTATVDILKWPYRKDLTFFLRHRRARDVVWVHASPPCTEYSRAKTTAPRNLRLADSLVRRAVHIRRFVRPTFWTLENPVGLLHTRPFMSPLDKYKRLVSYCRYGTEYRKDTHIWTNVDFEPRVCRVDTPCSRKASHGYHGVTAQNGPSSEDRVSGSSRGLNVYHLPTRLCRTIYREAIAVL